MSAVVAATGIRSEKIVDGRRKEVVPFVGTDRAGEFSSLGVGFLAEGGSQIWGLVTPHALIQSWRAMKLLENLHEITHSTLCCCWYVASEDADERDRKRVDELAAQFPSREAFDSVRALVLEAVPTNEELEFMLNTLREENVQVASYELTKLINTGKLASNPLVGQIVQEEEARRRQYEEKEKLIKEPMAPEGSLAVFFDDLGITNFIIGHGVGAYGIDWGHIEPKHLDEVAKRDCLSRYFGGFDLEHTTASTVPSGVNRPMASSDVIEEPWFLTDAATKFTFSKVVLQGGNFLVTTKIEKKGADPVIGQYSIMQLRELIGPLPAKKQSTPEESRPRFRWPRLFGRSQ